MLVGGSYVTQKDVDVMFSLDKFRGVADTIMKRKYLFVVLSQILSSVQYIILYILRFLSYFTYQLGMFDSLPQLSRGHSLLTQLLSHLMISCS